MNRKTEKTGRKTIKYEPGAEKDAMIIILFYMSLLLVEKDGKVYKT